MAGDRQGSISSGGNPPGLRKKDTDLARTYRHAEAGSAYHERESGASEPTAYDPTLAATFERPHFPLSDVVRPDKADGEVKGFTTGDAQQDAILSGFEPGEMGREPDHGDPVPRGGAGPGPIAPAPEVAQAERSDPADGGNRSAAADALRDAILSGLEPGES